MQSNHITNYFYNSVFIYCISTEKLIYISFQFLRAGFQRLSICFVSCFGKRFSIPEIKVPERNILIDVGLEKVSEPPLERGAGDETSALPSRLWPGSG